MTRYLLDTNVLSELLRKRPEPKVLAHLSRLTRDAIFTSSICVLELRFGAARHPGGRQLWARITTELMPELDVLGVDRQVAERAGELLADLERRGQPIGIEDVLIGATALVHGLVVVTRNLRHFERIDTLVVESWWA